MSSQAAESPFRHRGVVEGFYGTPWSHQDRLWWIERSGRLELDTYVVAPKDEPLLREDWRTPFPAALLEEWEELVAAGARCGVRVGFALSPGLSIRYSDPEDHARLREKLASLEAIGVRFHTLALDDVPSDLQHASDRAHFASLADAQASLLRELSDRLAPESTLWLVPTEYTGLEAVDHMAALGRSLPEGVEVAWTGRSVFSPEIRTEEAARVSEALGRPLLLWDNVPVTDGPVRVLLQLGPYQGREAGLARHCSGILLNPMERPRASALTVQTAAAWMAAPERYDPEASWRDAAEELGAGAPEAFRCFAAAHRFGPGSPQDRDHELEEALRALADEAGPRSLERVRELLDARLGVAEALRSRLADRRLLAEIEPWVAAHHAETRRMRSATEALATMRDPERPALDRCLAWTSLEGLLTRVPPPPVASYGARRLHIPQLVSMREREARFSREEPALFLDHNLADAWIDFVSEQAARSLGGVTSRGRSFGVRPAGEG